MPRVSLAFFALAAVCGLTGMFWGLWMGVTQNFAYTPAHAHLNLVGWTTLALMGGFYAFAGAARPNKLAWANFALSGAGGPLMALGLGLMIAGDEGAKSIIYLGVIGAIAGMILFCAAIVIVGLRSSAKPATPHIGAPQFVG